MRWHSHTKRLACWVIECAVRLDLSVSHVCLRSLWLWRLPQVAEIHWVCNSSQVSFLGRKQHASSSSSFVLVSDGVSDCANHFVREQHI
jgi:hypothetical protein